MQWGSKKEGTTPHLALKCHILLHFASQHSDILTRKKSQNFKLGETRMVYEMLRNLVTPQTK